MSYLVVRANSTSGAYIAERAAPGWKQSKADIARVCDTAAAAQKAADAINACEAADCDGCPDCIAEVGTRFPTEHEVRSRLVSTDSAPVALGLTSSGETVAIKFMGSIERPKSRGQGRVATYKWVDGYSVFIGGSETQPWLPFREAMRFARERVKG